MVELHRLLSDLRDQVIALPTYSFFLAPNPFLYSPKGISHKVFWTLFCVETNPIMLNSQGRRGVILSSTPGHKCHCIEAIRRRRKGSEKLFYISFGWSIIFLSLSDKCNLLMKFNATFYLGTLFSFRMWHDCIYK